MSHMISASHSKKFSSDFGPGKDHVRTAAIDNIDEHTRIIYIYLLQFLQVSLGLILK